MTLRKFKKHRYFHFTSRFVHSRWYALTPAENWNCTIRALNEVQKNSLADGLTWHSSVLMSNHIHVLFSLESYNEHSVILDFENTLKRLIQVRQSLFQRPVLCEPLQHFEYLKAAYKYIYRNPVEAGLSNRVEDYQYSSLSLILGMNPQFQEHPFIDPFEIIHDLPNRLRWLNSIQNWALPHELFGQDQGRDF